MRSGRHYLVYWRPDSIDRALSRGLLDYAGSKQFLVRGVAPEDVLWITGIKDRDTLFTIGPLYVTEIVDKRAAMQRRNIEYQAPHYALAADDVTTVPRKVSLETIQRRLEFVSPTSPRLDFEKSLGLQIQTIRQFTDASIDRLTRLWTNATAHPQRIP
jgi:hypothetical protein